MKIYPVILSGGAGSRLWPLSRAALPKQLLPLVSDKTMLQETALRLAGWPEMMAPLLICGDEHRFLVAEQMRDIAIAPLAIMLESVGRNTAPAVAAAAWYLQALDPQAIMLVLPADHVIEDRAAFHAAIENALQAASQGALATFGIVPTAPETGYGYIRRGAAIAGSEACYQIDRFVEKPDAQSAAGFVASGDYFWNSGMFLFSAASYLQELTQFQPAMASATEAAVRLAYRDLDFCRLSEKEFAACPADSLDYAVMEHTSRIVALIGVQDVIVVETADAVLVVHKDQVQRVKQVVSHLQSTGRTEHLQHTKVYRPWGCYEGIDLGDRFQVKRITVNPGGKLSLQMHHHRAEHWIVVSGTAQVTCGDEVKLLSENQSTYIPIGMTHRLENPGRLPLHLIEVQSGSYLGEDDIVRYEDVYKRV